ncbi:caspase family protein [Sphingomonas sp. BT-65]|uniref:caspase family protein n=1 Tax=Sphingomonas sp. BT-65 TaxID=2989821 RepID=UPI002235AB4C|nr:caspase family protein [Sphingomonas sp. BT-65]MCW4461014.1 caspase family protein [Sphingomonas sp. BT-65]
MNRALVVGIGDYGRLMQPLPGCANDRQGWSELLRGALGATGDALRVRADAQATKLTLLNDLAWLLDDVRPGDQRVFFFAGHGARLRRRDPVTGIADDVIDETIVAHPGASGDYESFMLFDADLAAMIDQSGFPPSARLTLIMDSCHSGGMMRKILMEDADVPLPRCLMIPEEDESPSRAPAAEPTVRSFGSLARAQVQVQRVILAAARAEQPAWDDRMPNGLRHGVFSYHALNALAAQPAISFSDMVATVAPQIAARFPQVPTLLGDSSRFSNRMFN